MRSENMTDIRAAQRTPTRPPEEFRSVVTQLIRAMVQRG